MTIVKVKDLQPGDYCEEGLVVRILPDDEAGKYLRMEGRVHVRIFTDHSAGICGIFLEPESFVQIILRKTDPRYLQKVEKLISDVVDEIHRGHADLDYLHQLRSEIRRLHSD